MKRILFIGLACVLCGHLAAQLTTISSPTTGLKAEFTLSSKIPYLTVRDAADKQVAKVKLGLKTSTANFTTGLSFVSAIEPEVITCS